VLKLVVMQGVKLALVGVAIGVVDPFFVTPVIGSQFGEREPDRSSQLHRRVAVPDVHRVPRELTSRRGARPPSIRSSRCAPNRAGAV